MQSADRQTHHIIVVALQPLHKGGCGIGLDPVGTRFVHGCSGGNISFNFRLGQCPEPDKGDLGMAGQLLPLQYRQSGHYLVGVSGQPGQHPDGFLRVFWLAQHAAVQNHHRICGDDDVLFLPRHSQRFFPAEPCHLFGNGLSRYHMLVNVRYPDGKGDPHKPQQLFAPMGGTDPAKQEIFCQESTLGQTDYGDTTGAEIMTLVGDIAAQSLDYIIMDELSMEYLSRGGWFGDVTAELTPGQLEIFADKLYTVQTEEGEIKPVAIDITDLPFVRDCALKVKKVYLVLPGNTKRAEKTDEFVDWLLAWPAEA